MGRNGSSKIRGGKQTTDGGREEERPDQGAADEEQSRIPLPLACIVRMMRQVLSADTTISGSAKKLAQDCGAESVGFISDEADERCRQQQQRRTLAPDDLVSSLRSLLASNATPSPWRSTFVATARGGAAGSSSSRAPVAPALTDYELLEILVQIIDEDGASSPAQAKPPAPHDYDHTGCM